jgi:threonine dehydratase
VVYRHFQATPQYRWALLSERLGTDCWVKHENHTPVGAFKIRGGLTYFEQLAQRGALPREVISATRGNHGQSVGWAARAHGVACTIVVPHGNSVEKERRDARPGRHADRTWRRLPGGPRARAAAGRAHAARTWCPAFTRP